MLYIILNDYEVNKKTAALTSSRFLNERVGTALRYSLMNKNLSSFCLYNDAGLDLVHRLKNFFYFFLSELFFLAAYPRLFFPVLFFSILRSMLIVCRLTTFISLCNLNE